MHYGVQSRRKLPHTPPAFVRSGELFFLTICSHPRHQNQLAVDDVWSTIRIAAEHYHQIFRWRVRLLLAMPDHVHLLASFPPGERMDAVVAAWKHFVAANTNVKWQRGFFDHRVRPGDNVDEKSAYIRMNPVRAGIAACPEFWPYVWQPTDVIASPD